MTLCQGNIFRIIGSSCGESNDYRPVIWAFYILIVITWNEPLNKHSSCRLFERHDAHMTSSLCKPPKSISFYYTSELIKPKSTLTLQWRHNGRDGVSDHQPHGCLLNRLIRCRSKKTSKLRVTGLCGGNSSVTGEFPAQRASDAENVSIWWCHHAIYTWKYQSSKDKISPEQFPTKHPTVKFVIRHGSRDLFIFIYLYLGHFETSCLTNLMIPSPTLHRKGRHFPGNLLSIILISRSRLRSL